MDGDAVIDAKLDTGDSTAPATPLAALAVEPAAATAAVAGAAAVAVEAAPLFSLFLPRPGAADGAGTGTVVEAAENFSLRNAGTMRMISLEVDGIEEDDWDVEGGCVAL